ncbi:mitochondrial coenzyme A diphosphatase NUDT8 [Genypterus blacodes]|uniref:mitochondrial coenzyme A diphosphatase NUDT8 n=1 Tax=Genypterus blacodes TaxID=154954 RepID=UPI003F76AF86
MFRGPQILTRPLLLGVSDPHLPAFCVHTGASGCHNGQIQNKCRSDEIVGRGRRKAGLSLAKETGSFSSLLGLLSLGPGHESSKNLTNRDHRLRQVSASTHLKLGEHLAEDPKAMSTYRDCLINTATSGLQPLQGRCWNSDHPNLSFIKKTKCNLLQSRTLYRSHFIRPFSSSMTQMACVVTRSHSRFPHCCCSFYQTRAFQAEPCEVAPLKGCLSLENEERCRHSLGPNLKLYEVDKRARGVGQNPGRGQGRWASVLVSLCSVDGEPAFLFTLRSSTLKGRHKGDVSFAGGKSDPLDRDVVATALREAQEELGVDVEAERVWGVLRPLRDMSGMMIAPVLANLGPLEALSFKPNPAEVDEIFTLSLSHLCSPQNRGYTHFRTGNKYGYTMPVFRNGKHRVWGLTAVALEHTLKLIVPP